MLRFDDDEGATRDVGDRRRPARHSRLGSPPRGRDAADRRLTLQLWAITGALWLWMLAYLLARFWLPPALAVLRAIGGMLPAALALASLVRLWWWLYGRR